MRRHIARRRSGWRAVRSMVAVVLLTAVALTGMATIATAAPYGYYRPHQLVAGNNTQCLTANELSFVVTDRLYTSQCARNWTAQLWDIVPAGNGYYTIVSRSDGRCIDVFGYRQWNGARVVTWTCLPGATNQQWSLTYDDLDHGWKVRARHDGKCLHSTPPWVAQYDCTGLVTHQAWTVTG